ncbi:MAG: hypothetical protein Kow0031_04410 [Anaerolineae bacterium]
MNGLLPGTGPRRNPSAGRGRRSHSESGQRAGHVIGSAAPQTSAQDVAIAATLRAAALRKSRRQAGGVGVSPTLIQPADLRVKVRRARTGNLILFVVDASGSMGARQRMSAVKGAVLGLLLDAYQQRDRVGLIAFRGRGAELLVPPTNSVELAERQLRRLPTGGKTPLLAGLQLAQHTLAQHQRQDAALAPLLVLVTDGRGNVGQPAQVRQAASALAGVPALVLDSEQGFVRLGSAREVAGWLGADYLRLDSLHADSIARQVRGRLKKQG